MMYYRFHLGPPITEADVELIQAAADKQWYKGRTQIFEILCERKMNVVHFSLTDSGLIIGEAKQSLDTRNVFR